MMTDPHTMQNNTGSIDAKAIAEISETVAVVGRCVHAMGLSHASSGAEREEHAYFVKLARTISPSDPPGFTISEALEKYYAAGYAEASQRNGIGRKF